VKIESKKLSLIAKNFMNHKVKEDSEDFFSIAGIWKERGIGLNKLREKAN